MSVFVGEDGDLKEFSLDYEGAADSHYEFTDEKAIRDMLYRPGDEKLYFHEILVRYVKEYGGNALLNQIMPYVTAQFHYDRKKPACAGTAQDGFFKRYGSRRRSRRS